MLCLPGTPPTETGKNRKKLETERNHLGCLLACSLFYNALLYQIDPGAGPIQDMNFEKRVFGTFPGAAPGILGGGKTRGTEGPKLGCNLGGTRGLKRGQK